MDRFCTCIFYSVNEFICLLYELVGCKHSEVDLKKIETCRSLSGLYVKVCIPVLVRFWHYLLIYTYLYILKNNAKNAQVCVYIYIYIYICVCVCVCARACVRVCVWGGVVSGHINT